MFHGINTIWLNGMVASMGQQSHCGLAQRYDASGKKSAEKAFLRKHPSEIPANTLPRQRHPLWTIKAPKRWSISW
jgi:hypothetical protein